MRKLSILSTLLVSAIFCCSVSYAQDFSNKGKDFWVAYGYHTIMASSNSQNMVLYFAAEQNTNVTVTIPGLGYTQNYFVAANTVLTSNPIPKAGVQDARLVNESTTPENKGIHITADRPIVAYAHIYNQSVSGASILFPTATLGREYYSINYKNISNTGAANCWFYVVAADTGTTTVEITPSAPTLTRPAGVPFQVTLTQGQVYNLMGQYSGNSGVDLTGSLIRSINTGSGCKRIAVFSGSGRISISCNNSPSSSDNYMVQAFPKTAWGRKFLTTTSGGNQSNNIYRICVSDPTTAVTLNGAPITYPLINNFYYELPASTARYRIEADNPITVAQYLTSQGECGNGNQPGDPEVIYLSPVEQNINRVLWNATPNFNILEHYYNVIIPNAGTAISSFRIDGAPVPASAFATHPQDFNYSYLIQQVSAGQHIIQSDSGFNAIAYGYGNAESYGYNAGTNIKDIFQYISVQNQQGTVNFPATCQNSPFFFSMTFPYQPTEIQWKFGPALNGMGIGDVTLTNPTPTSTIVVSGKTLYVYQLPTAYSIPAVGTYPIKVIAQNPTPDGCGGVQDIDFDVEVYESPTAGFNFTTDGCVTNPVAFTDNSNTNGRPQAAWNWDFGDASSSTMNNPTHIYGAPGSYTVKYSLVTDIGCVSDTASDIVTVNSLPVANFSSAGPYCEGSQVSFTDASTSANGAITAWEWDFGDGNTSNAQNPTHTYTTAGVYNVTLIVQTASGCSSLASTTQVTVFGTPTSDFSLPTSVCLPSGAAQFNDLSTAPAGSSVAAWQWNFGDGSPVSNLQNPLHNYTATGPYNVTLQVTTDQGCVDTKVVPINTIYAEPQAEFNSLPEVCVGSLIGFSDQSTAPGSTVTGWSWDFGDGSPVSTVQNPSHTFTTPGTFNVTLNVTSATGCPTVNNAATHQVIVNPLPTASIAGNTVVCLNAPSPSVTFTGGTGTAPYTFTYNINGGANQTVSTTSGNSVTVSVPTSTAGTFTYNLVNVRDGSAAQCVQSQTGSATVTVNPLPIANISGTTTVCLNAASPSITFTGSSGSAPYTFTYNINGGANQTVTTTSGNSVTVLVPTATAGTYTYNLVSVQEGSSNLCSQAQTGSATVIVNPLPQAAITSAVAEVCLNAASPSITFTGSAGSAPYTFTYNINGGTNQTVTTTSGNSVTVSVPTSTAGTFTYNLVGVQEGSPTQCSQAQTGTVTVVINPLPTTDFNAGLPVCETGVVSFTDASIANAGNLNSWTWNFDDPGSGAANTSTLQNPTHVFATAGNYNVTLNVTTDKGCAAPVFTKGITVNERPLAGFTPPEICIADIDAPFFDNSTIAAGTVTGWEWDFGDPGSGAANTSTLQNPTHTYTTVGTYTAQLIATSGQGCKDTIQQQFVVNGSVPVADFNVQNPTALCSNMEVSIQDASSVDFGNIIKTEIYWDYLNDPTNKTTDLNPVPGKVYTNTYTEFGTPATRSYRVRYVVYSGINCLHSITRDITLLATPTLQFDPVPFSCSVDNSFQITQAQLLNGLPGSGVFTGTGVTSDGIFSPPVAGTGLHTIRYTYTGTNGCTNFEEQTVAVYQTPAINAGPDKVVLEGGQVTLTPVQNIGDPLTYLWTPPTGLNDPTVAFPIASPATDITYTLTVTTDKGCTASDDVFVKLLKAPAIPNIFSPNGDGVHDRWVIEYLDTYPGCTVDVYNRYGQLVYHSVGYTTPWDGTVNGKPVPVGTYYYIVNPKNGRSQMSGYVDVIR